MMAPFDGSGPPPQGQPGVGQPMQRGPMPPGHMQGNPSPVMPVGHQHPMNAYGHPGRSGGMPQHPYGMPPHAQSPGRQSGFNPMNGGYSAHPPLHSPHQPPPPHGPPMHMQQRMPHRGSMGGGNSMGMHMQHDSMRGASQHTQSGGMQQRQQQQYMQQPPPPPQQQQQQQPPQQQQQNNQGNWQSERDMPHRREMIQHIVKLLKKDKPGSPESMQRLPQMAKQLEVALYRDAPSFEAYMNMSTLKQRLQQIAVNVAHKTREQSDRNRHSSQDRQPTPQQQQPPPQPPPPPPQQQQQYHSSSSGRPDAPSPYMQNHSGSGSGSSSRLNPNDMMQQPLPQHQQPYSSSSSSRGGMSSRSGNDPDVKIRIRHKQQRLLLLHHSAKCPHEDRQCPVTPHCADMKRLWRHMEACKDNQCKVAHCFSSRAILSHYRKCRDPACPACGPVRETVRRNRGSSSSSGNRGSSSRSMMGPMHDPLQQPQPISSQQQQQQHDPLTGSMGSFGNSSIPNSRPMQGSMPPPDMNQSSQSSRHQMQPQSHQQQQIPSPPPQPHPQQPHSQQPHNQQPHSQQQVSSQQYGNQGNQPYNNSSRGAPTDAFSQNKNGDSSRGMSSSQNMRGSTPKDQLQQQSSSSASTSSVRLNRSDPEYQKIRHKQQRLLLLRHASRCQHEAGKCPVTPHCESMRRLWEHIAHCKNQSCTVQHCLSSRYVLSHYRRCRDPRCPACGPVRDTIRKSSRDGSGRHSTNSNSFDNLSSSDVVAPQPSPVQQASPRIERAQKRIKTDHVVAVQPTTSDSSAPSALDSPAQPQAAESSVDVEKAQETIAASTPAEREPSVPNKGNADSSLLNSFTVKQLETHLSSLNRKTQLAPSKLKSKCLECLKGLQTHQHGWVFNCPVDPVELGLPDYFDIIKKPMDLGTIQKRLENGAYHAIEDFEADVALTFDNAMTYNEKGSVVYDMAKELKAKFVIDYRKLLDQLDAEDQQRRQNERACTLCGCEKLLFEPPVYFCNGMNCQSQRIRRNSHFYVGGNNQYYWCSTCYNELDDKIPIELVDMSIMKADLKKKKNDEVHEESWVQCDSCNRWVHQICGLFNTRQNKEHHSEYCCPKCLLNKRKTTNITPDIRPLMAADLPRTTLSEWLETHITKKLEQRKRDLAAEKSQVENMSLEEAMSQVESGGPVFIRQVTAMDRKLEVRELMRKRYEHKKYPEEFPFRCKCIVVFQHLDGVDVLLFALYVYEHGEDNPPPNQRVVYISYLDSVHFMRPRKIRTFVYHEILIAYLDYARRRGFATAHIWACPPLKGDDYIFYAKPEDQKTPRDSRLRQWYIDMLVECQKRNIVGKITNMYDLYFANENLDATAVPYLEGDYFPGEAENIIKLLQEGGGKKGGGGGKKKKSKNSAKNKGNTGTRSTGVDEEALIASGILDGPKSFKDLDRDQVMVKLGETIQPMKESFIVAFLNWSGAKEEDMIVPEAIEKARLEYAAKKDDGDLAGSKRDAIGSVREVTSMSKEKVVDDDAEDLDCEFLNNRQAFLNLCRGNHYQFDQLRRAKHTSMMVLWHLHNRDAPKFVQQCVSCNREIVSGKRYHCNVCADYDLCQECYKDPNCNRGSCTHDLQAIAVESDSGEERTSGLTDAQRKERQRKVMMHIQLIEHASRCKSKSCQSSNCSKMKTYIKHANTCRVKVQGGCKICKKIWTLLRLHAQKCKERTCPIPQCNAIREKLRQLQKQQQAMDDRRRLEMNRHMRFSTAGGAGH